MYHSHGRWAGVCSENAGQRVNDLSLSSLVLLAFLAASAVFLLLARTFARKPVMEIRLAAVAIVVISSALLWTLSELSVLLNRTPALVHAGFAALVLVWATLRRDTSVLGPPARATIRSDGVSWVMAIPGGGVLLSLPALWDILVLSPQIVGLLQMTALASAWLTVMRRADRTSSERYVAGHEASQRIVRIFVSYRREDSADVTGRLYDRLVARFGRERVFKDVDSIPLGVDFRTHLQEVVSACDVVVAVIGERWVSVGEGGSRRLDDLKDFVRIELETALRQEIPVIPVLVGAARMPSVRDLPSTLAALAYRHGQSVRPDPDFHHDMDRLIHGLENHPRTVGRRNALS